MNNIVIILYDNIKNNMSNDQKDTLIQVNLVKKYLKLLNYKTINLPCNLNISIILNKILKLKPDFCFNLLESYYYTGKLQNIIPQILDHCKIPYTGSKAEAIYITTNKILTKEILIRYNIKTPGFYLNKNKNFNINLPAYFIFKPISEDASIGIFDENIILIEKEEDFNYYIKNFNRKYNCDFFAEEYIEGREFNISLLANKNSCEVMPIYEILFNNYNNKPKIVGYNAKWIENSFEFNNTPRNFNFNEQDNELLLNLSEISKKCWNIFNLKGYARIDFRVKNSSNIYIIDVNTNPCLSEDAGFYASCKKNNLNYIDIIKRIIDDI